MARPDLSAPVVEMAIELKKLFDGSARASDCLTAMFLHIAGLVNDERTDMTEVVRDIEWLRGFLKDSREKGAALKDGKAAELVAQMKAGKPAKEVLAELVRITKEHDA